MPPGKYAGTLRLDIPYQTVNIAVSCHVDTVEIPALNNARLGMLNFFCYENIAAQHRVPQGSEAYWELFRQYVRMQLEMRCTHILLPCGSPVRDGNGNVTGFDFSDAERAGRIASGEGAPFVCGGHIAHWHEWDAQEYYWQWDDSVGISSQEGYFQLRSYFTE